MCSWLIHTLRCRDSFMFIHRCVLTQSYTNIPWRTCIETHMCRDACIFIQTGVRDAFIHTYAVTHLHRCAVTDAYSYTNVFVTHSHTDVSTQSLRGAYCIFEGVCGHLARLIPPWVISHESFLRNESFQNPLLHMPLSRRDVPSQCTCVAATWPTHICNIVTHVPTYTHSFTYIYIYIACNTYIYIYIYLRHLHTYPYIQIYIYIFATSSHTYPLTHTHMHTRMPATPHTHIREKKTPIHPPPPT